VPRQEENDISGGEARDMIEAISLTKRYGPTVAVDGLSFTVKGGQVTGFLGPNGAGKSTTMRMILGLDRPSAGSVTIDGVPYQELDHPLRKVGALLDAKAVHGGRTARNHLLCLAQANGIPARRVGEVLDIVGLGEVAKRRVGGFSLGMSQRLGIAAALLGDPEILMFDEPVNGLDPEGIVWIRTLMRNLAAEGRTVFVSSHLMSEMALTADHLIVIGRGRLIADTSTQEFIASSSQRYVRVAGNDLAGLAARVERHADHLRVTGVDPRLVGEAAATGGIVLHELTMVEPSLETAFMELTQQSAEFQADVASLDRVKERAKEKVATR
jgi:ABC-2 type transport system ATP-binding protein